MKVAYKFSKVAINWIAIDTMLKSVHKFYVIYAFSIETKEIKK